MSWRRWDSRLRALRSLPELAPFADSQLRSLLPYFDEVTVGAGSVLAARGRPCTQYVVVLDGHLEVRDGRGEHPADSYCSTGWAGMLERGWSQATVVAASPARLLVMGRAQFRAVRALIQRCQPTDASNGRGNPRLRSRFPLVGSIG